MDGMDGMDALRSLVIARDNGMKHGPTSSMIIWPCFQDFPSMAALRYLIEDGDFPLQTVKKNVK